MDATITVKDIVNTYLKLQTITKQDKPLYLEGKLLDELKKYGYNYEAHGIKRI